MERHLEEQGEAGLSLSISTPMGPHTALLDRLGILTTVFVEVHLLCSVNPDFQLRCGQENAKKAAAATRGFKRPST